MGVCIRVGVVVWCSTPESALVDLQTFVFGPAKHHRSDAPVAKWQRFGPFPSWFVICEPEGGIGASSHSAQSGYCDQDQYCSYSETNSLLQHYAPPTTENKS